MEETMATAAISRARTPSDVILNINGVTKDPKHHGDAKAASANSENKVQPPSARPGL